MDRVSKIADEWFSEDGLLYHSFWMGLSSVSLAVSGVLFWWLAARFYSLEDIGFAVAVIFLC
jgi:hypothetical protein